LDARQITKLLSDWIPREASVAIADKDNYVDYHAGIYDIQIRPGQRVPSGSIAARVRDHKCRMETMVDASVFGVPYYGMGYPLENEKGFYGSLAVVLPPRYSNTGNTLSFVTGKKGEIWTPIPMNKISYFESFQKKTWFYTSGGRYSTKYTLQTLEQRLPSRSFLRIHRSFIVNVDFIQSISRDISSNLILTLSKPDGCKLSVSQNYIRQVRSFLGF
jgi:two-component system, LytTR family, response regulator LytT